MVPTIPDTMITAMVIVIMAVPGRPLFRRCTHSRYAELNGPKNGIGVTITGITLRSDYSKTIPNADRYSTGKYCLCCRLNRSHPVPTAAGRVAGIDLFRNNFNVIPDTDGAYTIGETEQDLVMHI